MKVHGRKRHLLTDTLGIILVIAVTAANVHDKTTTEAILTPEVMTTLPRLKSVSVDSACRDLKVIGAEGEQLGVVLATKSPDQNGFVPLPVRWRIERTNGWMTQWRRLPHDYERTVKHSRGMVLVAMTGILLRWSRKDPGWQGSAEKPLPDSLLFEQSLLLPCEPGSRPSIQSSLLGFLLESTWIEDLTKRPRSFKAYNCLPAEVVAAELHRTPHFRLEEHLRKNNPGCLNVHTPPDEGCGVHFKNMGGNAAKVKKEEFKDSVRNRVVREWRAKGYEVPSDGAKINHKTPVDAGGYPIGSGNLVPDCLLTGPCAEIEALQTKVQNALSNPTQRVEILK